MVPAPPPIESTASASESYPRPLSRTVKGAPAGCARSGAAATNRHARIVRTMSLAMARNRRAARRCRGRNGVNPALTRRGTGGERKLVEVRTQPALGLLDRDAAAGGIVLELVAADPGDAEILAVAMAEIE